MRSTALSALTPTPTLGRAQVRLMSASTALWIRSLRGCTVFAMPVRGSVYVTACEDCTLYLGSRQLRIHTSKSVDFYVHANSHPIIEHCAQLRFAPYPSLPPALAPGLEAAGLRAESNQWELVDDFDWLKATHSPNWQTLPLDQRIAPHDLDELGREAGEVPPAAASTAAAKGEEAAKTAEQTASTAAEAPTEIA